MYKLAKLLSGDEHVIISEDFQMITGCIVQSSKQVKKIIEDYLFTHRYCVVATSQYQDSQDKYQVESWSIELDDNQMYVIKLITSPSQYCNVFVIGKM